MESKTETLSESMYTEQDNVSKQEQPNTKTQKVDPEVWKKARSDLRDLLDDFGNNVYQSNTCKIVSV